MIAIEISYQISNMLVDPVEETILEMPLHLSICYPPRALQPDLIKGPFQPCGKGGNLLMVTLCNFIPASPFSNHTMLSQTTNSG